MRDPRAPVRLEPVSACLTVPRTIHRPADLAGTPEGFWKLEGAGATSTGWSAPVGAADVLGNGPEVVPIDTAVFELQVGWAARTRSPRCGRSGLCAHIAADARPITMMGGLDDAIGDQSTWAGDCVLVGERDVAMRRYGKPDRPSQQTWCLSGHDRDYVYFASCAEDRLGGGTFRRLHVQSTSCGGGGGLWSRWCSIRRSGPWTRAAC
jgi:hypothetical protein